MGSALLSILAMVLANVRVTGVSSDAPRIAVLTAPSTTAIHQDYVPAAYIDWLQSAGAVAVPIPSGVYWNTSLANWAIEQSEAWSTEQYEQTFRGVNGLLLPGGDPWTQVSSGALRHLLALAKTANKAGDYFPIFGICAGMETMAVLATEGCQSQVTDGNIPAGTCGQVGPVTRGFDAENISLNLDLQLSAAKSKLFSAAPEDLLTWLQQENLTFNYHEGGVSPRMFNTFQSLGATYSPLSVNKDRAGNAFVSTMEAKELPYYGLQWHPAKTMFEWGVKDNHPYEAINHSSNAVKVSQYMANFFISEAHKSKHAFPSASEAMRASIFNYAPSVYNSSKPMYTRTFLFDWKA